MRTHRPRLGLALLLATGCSAAAPPAPPLAPPTTPAPSPPASSAARSPAPPAITSADLPATPNLPAASVPGPATDAIERQHRLAQVLPRQTPHYRIDYRLAPDGRLGLTITLLAVRNGPADGDRYAADLRAYRDEAVAFIRAQGDDPATYTVSFLPPEAASL